MAYENLRYNLIINILEVYDETGYLFESYHPETG
jgi:hypothetical protein